jgi:hypothetical protein
LTRILQAAPDLEDCTLQLQTVAVDFLLTLGTSCPRLRRVQLESYHKQLWTEEALSALTRSLPPADGLFTSLAHVNLHEHSNEHMRLPVAVQAGFIRELARLLQAAPLLSLRFNLYCPMEALTPLAGLRHLRALKVSNGIRRKAARMGYETANQIVGRYSHSQPRLLTLLRGHEQWMTRMRNDGDDDALLSSTDMLRESGLPLFIEQRRWNGMDGREAFFNAVAQKYSG